MLAQPSPWYAHAVQRVAAGLNGPLPAPERLEWATRPGYGPGAELLGADLPGTLITELGCGTGHNAAHLAGLASTADQGPRARGRWFR